MASTPSGTLTDLPDELLEDVIHPLDTRELATLCGLCRRLNRVCTPRLYSKLESDVLDVPLQLDRPHPIALALRSVVCNRTLATHVEHFAASSDWPLSKQPPLPEDVDETYLNAWRPDDRQHDHLRENIFCAVQDLLPVFGYGNGRKWLGLLARGRIEAIVAGFVLVCVNLRSMKIGSLCWTSERLDQLLSIVFAQASNKALSQVQLCPDIISQMDLMFHQTRYDCLDALLGLPAFFSISAPLPCLHLGHMSSTSSLRTLTIKRSQVSDEDLGRILRCTPGLEELTCWVCYHWAGGRGANPPHQDFDDYIDCARLDRSLLHVRRSLRKLSLSFNFYSIDGDCFGMDLRGCRGALRALKHFERLETMVVPFVLLLDWTKRWYGPRPLSQALPRSLTTLILTRDLVDMGCSFWSVEELADQLEGVARSRNGEHRLKLKVHNWRESAETSLVASCSQRNVEVEAVSADDTASAHHVPAVTRQRHGDYTREGSRLTERGVREWLERAPTDRGEISPRTGRRRGGGPTGRGVYRRDRGAYESPPRSDER